jgi:gag-polypeptide of LTR copia-type
MADHNLPIFQPDQLLTWQQAMKSFLQTKKCWKPVEGFPRTEDEKLIAKQEETTTQCVGWLKKALGDTYAQIALTYENEDQPARSIWRAIEAEWGQHNLETIITTQQSWDQIKWKPDDSPDKLIGRMESIHRQLRQLGIEKNHNETLVKLLMNLPAHLEAAKDALRRIPLHERSFSRYRETIRPYQNTYNAQISVQHISGIDGVTPEHIIMYNK